MASVREFVLPDLGEGLTEAEIVRWLVAVGDVIAVDQPVAEVETAKAVVEVPCPYPGVVTTLAGPEGAVVPVGAPLITVATSEASTADSPKGKGDAHSGSGNVLVGYGTSHSSGPRRRRVAHPGSPTAPTAAVPAPVVVKAPVAVKPAAHAVAVISPLVRRFAREQGLDLATVSGTGRDGLIMRADVERAVQARTVPMTGPNTTATEGEFIPLRGGARIAAERFARSRTEIPDATCWVDADATALLEAKAAVGVGVLPLFARVCVAALRRFPALNSSVELGPDGHPTGVRRHRAIHLGFAAQSERGLVVPVVRDADRLTTEELATEIARLTESARAGSLTPAELTGSTFTLNNYGVFGVDGSTPIINHPEAAMLGVGRIARKPWVVGEELAVRSVVQLSFTFDHRVCDGATAGGFLRFVADAVESPVGLLRHM
ncbi:dihydrolipoamide acetyltransferase family protein [Streptacidiphilus melanogenes]|uniref:dihydrolipoamide acetyltransferase family protein n=1 Tax=Streptacidiphilus melanogenes TaxID=411235 RepID=UPI0005AAFA43|nr:dihydrolipoamide acetyltransferase family protein [Streptacidiphilus melanogenes]